jgi:hypothetical protein
MKSCRRRWRCCRRNLHGIDHITLGNAAAAAAATKGICINFIIGGHFLGRRHYTAYTHRSCRRSICHGSGFSSNLSRLAIGIDGCNDLFAYHGAAVTLNNAHQHAGLRRGCFQHHLVGFDFNEDFVDRNRFAGLLFPLQQGGLGHGF